MQKIRFSALLMIIAMIGVTGFQAWWLKSNYDRENKALDIQASAIFRNTVLALQAKKFRIEDIQIRVDSGGRTAMMVTSNKGGKISISHKNLRNPEITMMNVLQEKMKDSSKKDSTRIIIIQESNDTLIKRVIRQKMPEEREKIRRTESFLYNIDSLAQHDPITLKELDSALKHNLLQEKLSVGASVWKADSLAPVSDHEVSFGFARQQRFDFTLTSSGGYIFRKLQFPLLFSLLLVGITIASFVLLYRNLMKQKRLAELKNEFISNITHELKTPIATVGVAIEALKNFSAMDDPKRTEEYLDISQQELQRLNLLVDKVLKLSMFENKMLDMNFEPIDLGEAVKEVLSSLRLQIEKYKAVVHFTCSGNLQMQGDRLHLLSVIYNLLDNALKYGKAASQIDIEVKEKTTALELVVRDNGIGIPAAYQDKVFEKFFRVPHGDTHNAKGYGLGLSYVAQVIKDHGGKIVLKSEEGKGSTFTIEFPTDRP